VVALLRCRKTAAAVIIFASAMDTLCVRALFSAPAIVDGPMSIYEGAPLEADGGPEVFTDQLPNESFASQYEGQPMLLDEFGAHGNSIDPIACPPPGYRSCMTWLGLRHSYTHCRNVGLGGPLVGTSWLNRPYYVGIDLGPLWMTRSVADSVNNDIDVFGGIFIGCDWDHYWGNELAFHWATPELINSNAPDAQHSDSLFLWSYNLMYYPWGDAAIRPYWRWGIGNTHVNVPLDDASGHDEWLLTFPIGVGMKCPIRPWLAARAELTDQLAFGDSNVHTQHNLTLTFGLEWRFGAHPRSYWPWHPSRHIW
jgi:hypothetical protein